MLAVLKVWYSAVYSVLCTLHFSSFQGDIAKLFKTKTLGKKARMCPHSSNNLHSEKE